MSQHKVRDLIYGSLIQSVVTTVAIGFSIAYALTDMLITDEILRVWVNGFIFTPNIPPAWLLQVFKLLMSISGFAAILITPVLISFVYGRSFINSFLKIPH